MDYETSERAEQYRLRLTDFMDDVVLPAEATYRTQMRESGDPHFHPPIIEDLKVEAKRRGLWNLFYAHADAGSCLTNLEYAPLAEIMGRSPFLAPEATNCAAPDTGNIDVLAAFGTDEQKRAWLDPLLAGEIRSGFAMTEPDVASSDATSIQMRMDRDGDEYVLNGRKWWTTNALHPNCRVLIVMGKTDLQAAPHRQQSMMVVPIDTPGVRVVRSLPVFGYLDRQGHGEVEFVDVRVPSSALLAGEGEGFMIGQARLGPGRIHHCMRSIGTAERALELLVERAADRSTFGSRVVDRANIQDWIAESRVEIEMARQLTLKTAWLMDTVGNKEARVEIAAIKIAAPQVALRVIDRAIQVFGGAGVSDDFPLAELYANQRTLRIADGPDEVHKRVIARQELRRHGVEKERAHAH